MIDLRLTNAEAKKLRNTLVDLLSKDSYLGSRYRRMSPPDSLIADLAEIRIKLDNALNQ